MNAHALKSSLPTSSDSNGADAPRPSPLVWACLPLGLAAGAGVLLLFGVSWWTTLLAVLFVACPAATAIAMRVCFCKTPGLPDPGSGRSKSP